jgi:4-amino-4-deoxy-L-arabinose transferase-like glycosyltransferase
MWRKLLLVTLALSALLRFGLLSVNEGLWWDEAVYLSLARSIKQGRYEIPIGMESFRPPLFPLVVAICLLGGELGVRVVVAILSLAAILSTYWLGKSIGSEATGCLAATFLAFSPPFLFFSQRILAEGIFLAFSGMALACFHLGLRGKRHWLCLSGLFVGLSVLTKYWGLCLPLVCLGHVALAKKAMACREVLLATLVFALLLLPILLLGQVNYGNPLGGLVENALIFLASPPEPPHFYLMRLHSIFGPWFVLLPLGIWTGFRRKELLILVAFFLPAIMFHLLQHKEARYFLWFMPVSSCLAALGMESLGERHRSAYLLLPLIILVGLYQGLAEIMAGREAGVALKEGTLFLRQVTSEDEVVMSESYPWVSWYSQRPVIRPPESADEFYQLIEEYDVRYALVHVFEPGNPAYLMEELQGPGFEEVEAWQEWGRKAVVIYRRV